MFRLKSFFVITLCLTFAFVLFPSCKNQATNETTVGNNYVTTTDENDEENQNKNDEDEEDQNKDDENDEENQNEVEAEEEILPKDVSCRDFVGALQASQINIIKVYLQKNINDIVNDFKNTELDIPLIQNPENFAYYCVATGSLKIGDLENAYKYYTKLLTSSSINKDDIATFVAYRNRALCTFIMNENNVEEAMKDIKEILGVDKEDWLTYYYAGVMESRSGNRTIALEDFRKAKSICEDNSEFSSKIQERIDELENDNRWNELYEGYKKGNKVNPEIISFMLNA